MPDIIGIDIDVFIVFGFIHLIHHPETQLWKEILRIIGMIFALIVLWFLNVGTVLFIYFECTERQAEESLQSGKDIFVGSPKIVC